MTMSNVKRYDMYQTLWIPVIRACLLSEGEPEKPTDKQAVVCIL